MNYTDPSGHICVEDDGDSDAGMVGNCGGGSNPNYKGGLQGSPSGWAGHEEGSEDEENIGCGQSVSVECPPKQNACYKNLPCTIAPETSVHPNDYLFPPIVGKNYLYGNEDQILGYQEIYMMPPGNILNFHLNRDANAAIPDWDNVSTQAIAKGLDLLGCAGFCSAIMGTINGLDLIDQTIIYEGRLVTGPIIPLNESQSPELPRPWLFPPITP